MFSFTPPAVSRTARSAAPSSAAWSAEIARAAPYLEKARWHWAAGRLKEAVAAWEAALRDVPGLLAPRRQEIAGRIRTASYEGARRAVQGQEPDLRTAAAWLACWLRHADGAEERERLRVRQLYAVVLHLAGERGEALRCYEELEAAPRGAAPARDGVDWRYGATLLRLQQLAPPARAGRSGSAPPGTLPARAAWARLHAFEALASGDVGRAAAAFPAPSEAGLPGAWALAGGLLAALAGRWEDSIAYFELARSTGALDDGPAGDLPRLIFVAAALQRAAAGAPLSPEVEAFAMSLRLPARPPRGAVRDAASYARWAAAVRRWQQQLWVRRALQELTVGDVESLRSTLRAVARRRPHASLSRWIRVWLACTGSVGEEAMDRSYWLQRSRPSTDAPRHLWRLAVLAAERFGMPADVVERLHQLLERFPDDEWALARWRSWMLKLAEDAFSEGRFKQALLQYVSLILYLPDDPDGWEGCAQMLELMDMGERANDCRRQARAAASKARRVPKLDDEQVKRNILQQLLAEPLPVSKPSFPFALAALRRAALQTLHEPDGYLRSELERWAASTS